MSDHIDYDHLHDPIIVERPPSPMGVIVALLLALVIAGAVWLLFLAGDETRDQVVPDDVDVTVEEN
jgi:hypothetical protein